MTSQRLDSIRFPPPFLTGLLSPLPPVAELWGFAASSRLSVKALSYVRLPEGSAFREAFFMIVLGNKTNGFKGLMGKHA